MVLRHPRLQPPKHAHDYRKHRTPVYHNSIHGNPDELTHILADVENTSLNNFKKNVKTYVINKYSFYLALQTVTFVKN